MAGVEPKSSGKTIPWRLKSYKYISPSFVGTIFVITNLQ